MSKNDSYRGGSTVIHLGSNWFSRPKPPDPARKLAREKAEEANRKWLEETSPDRTRKLERARDSRVAKKRAELQAKSSGENGNKGKGGGEN